VNNDDERDHAEEAANARLMREEGDGLYLEEDRFLVLLACGHWTQTRRPDDMNWWCPFGDNEQDAVTALEGERAVLESWDYRR
jgi:hypothetical protein